MLVISDSAGLARALDSPISPALRCLLIIRRDQLTADGFDEIGDIARFIIAQPGDTLEAVETEIGMPIRTNIIDGSPYPLPGYQPNWEWCLRHGDMGWEAPFILSDDGYGIVLIVLNEASVDPTLLDICRSHS